MNRTRATTHLRVGKPVTLTSGLFNLPSLPRALGVDLRVYISNFGQRAETAYVTVTAPEGYGKGVLSRTRLLVPAKGTAVHKLDVKGYQGGMVEVELNLSGPTAKPSLAVVETCEEEGKESSERTVFYLSPSAFPMV